MLTVTWHVSVVERRAGTTGGARAPGEPGEQTPTTQKDRHREGARGPECTRAGPKDPAQRRRRGRVSEALLAALKALKPSRR